MPWTQRDARTWSATDRPGERIAITRPLAGIEVLSISGSNRHWRDVHDGFTLALVHRNQPGLLAEWRTRGRSMSARAGNIMAIEPGDAHVTERLLFPAGGADFDLVRLSSRLVAEAAKQIGGHAAFHFDSPCLDDAPTFDALGLLVDATAEGKDPSELEAVCVRALHSVISRLGESPACPAGLHHGVRDYRVRRVRDYLHAHLDRRPSLSELETVAQLSKWRLSVIFEQAYGTSIGNYWRALRVRDASARLLRGTPIKLIVAELGYADAPHFCREFKAHYGLTPGRWLQLGGVARSRATRG